MLKLIFVIRTLVNPDEARFIDMESVAVMVTEETKVM